jgi:cellulose synthase/poly-beta-1,6-N-acetylglucosamine synthase-like glycosyltransferase
MAYNEEANIGRLLDALSREPSASFTISEIIVVSSGSTDRTAGVVGAHAAKDRRIRLLVQEKREGKASAVNLFLSHAAGDLIILQSADTLPVPGAVEKLLQCFHDPGAGMAGARPVPVNEGKGLVPFAVRKMWRLHHLISLETPKVGEMVAFRPVVKQIPADTAVDEACLEAMIHRKGYRICYAPDAVVRNRGPENIRDFLRQRRRIAAGHRHLARTTGYRVSTSGPLRIARHLLGDLTWDFRDVLFTGLTVLLESAGRFLGFMDYHIRKKNPFIWDIAETTKKL